MSNWIVVNYEITNVDFDPEAFESLEPNSLNPDEIGNSIGYITQSPGKEKGSVRIPPGQKYSDVIVVPIDDKVDENIDKTLIKKVKIFDVYEGKNIPSDKKSIALKVTIQSDKKTLNEDD